MLRSEVGIYKRKKYPRNHANAQEIDEEKTSFKILLFFFNSFINSHLRSEYFNLKCFF